MRLEAAAAEWIRPCTITQPVCKEATFVFEQLCSKISYTALEKRWQKFVLTDVLDKVKKIRNIISLK